jgi:2'-hydroxyisoflavone reductase
VGHGLSAVRSSTAQSRPVTTSRSSTGTTNPELFPDAEKLRGDRLTDLSALDGREWDVVVDVAAYEPDAVARSTAQLRDAVARYVFVSTVSVYADHSGTHSEDERLEAPGESYGAKKAMGEAIVRESFGDRATIIRAGMIAGPHDTTDRLSYWPKRIACGGRVLAPGAPDDPIQFIDVRDLADFVLRAPNGTFNATGEIVPLGELLETCKRVTASDADLVWVSTERLLAAGLEPFMGVPLWIARRDGRERTASTFGARWRPVFGFDRWRRPSRQRGATVRRRRSSPHCPRSGSTSCFVRFVTRKTPHSGDRHPADPALPSGTWPSSSMNWGTTA